MFSRKPIIRVEPPIPLIGCIAFGLIDRGTNVIQVRPISTCPLSCIFCSTDAGPDSKVRQVEYIVPLDYLVEEFRKIVKFKGEWGIEAHIDTVGDPLTYPNLVELVHQLKSIKGVEVVSMQTHGFLLTEKILDRLSAAGLSRINLSIDALNPELAKKLAGTTMYDVNRIVELAKYTVESTNIELLIAPVWILGLNDNEIPKIVEFACKIKAGGRWPPLGIQKYEIHKHGRKVKGVKSFSWKEFYSRLKLMEKDYKVKLILSHQDFKIHKRPLLPKPYKKFDKVKLKIVGLGWLKKEKIALTREKDRVITLINAEDIPIGSTVKARIVADKHNIYLAEVLT
ncbi:radical SAM protein [Candidatus Bathyarchaeota archaeon]|nr:MAG: radical SAM protein [Candidatus Bathyarchaeota archaeon]